jgi:hypothetical protein
MKLNIDDSQHFGVEIEYLNVHENDVKKAIINNLVIYKWDYHKEYTITHESGSAFVGEIVSPILTNSEGDFKQIEAACKILLDLGARVDSQCGGHIHFDSNILEKNGEYFQNFLLLYLYYENVIYEFAAGYDKSIRDNVSDYARRLLPDMTIYQINKLIKHNFDYKDFIKTFVYGSGRNQGVNFRNLLNRHMNTIEFRMPNGTLNSDIWHNNITIFGRLLELSKNVNPDQKVYLHKKVLEQRHNLLNYYFYNIEKEYEFLTFISNDKEDTKRFIKQYKKRI